MLLIIRQTFILLCDVQALLSRTSVFYRLPINDNSSAFHGYIKTRNSVSHCPQKSELHDPERLQLTCGGDVVSFLVVKTHGIPRVFISDPMWHLETLILTIV